MADGVAKSAAARFFPELRGWAALKLARSVPQAVRDEMAGFLDRRGLPAHFPQDAVALVSRPASVAWSREVAARFPALGPSAGPACLARLWVLHLLGSDRALAAYWSSVVDVVWNVVRPAMEKIGVPAGGPQREELRHEVAAPLALVFLKSVAAGRKDFRLVGIGDLPARLEAKPRAGRHGRIAKDGPPFGWAPGIDALGLVIRYLVMGQVPGRFHGHAFLSSALARVMRGAGLAFPVVVSHRHCRRCRVILEPAWRRCPHCGGPLELRRSRRLVARAILDRRPALSGGPTQQVEGWSEGAAGSGGSRRAGVGVSDGAMEAADRMAAVEARRRCIRRARRLWDRVIQGRGANVSAMVILGALAGVDPLERVADRPPPERQWLDHLVDVLVERRLARQRLAAVANAALGLVAERLGCPMPPKVLSAYLGVRATRFRHMVFGRRGGG